MANICNTTYEIYGTKEELNKLKNSLEKAKEIAKNDKDNYEKTPWVSDLYKAITGKADYDNFAEGDGNMFFISCEDERIVIDMDSKWAKVEEFEDILNKYFEDLSIFYITEEFGCGIWETNDTKGDVFEGKYYAEIDGDGDYFNNDDELLEYVNDYFEEYAEGEHNFKDVKSFKEFCDNLSPEDEDFVLRELKRI